MSFLYDNESIPAILISIPESNTSVSHQSDDDLSTDGVSSEELSLRSACWHGNIEEVQNYLAKGFKINNDYPLIYETICNSQNYAIVELLLKHGANPNIQTMLGNNALDKCISSGQLSMVKLLLAYNTDPFYKYHGNGFTSVIEHFIYHSKCLHCERIHPSDYDINPDYYLDKHNKGECYTMIPNHYHDPLTMMHIQIAWYLYFKFPYGFKDNEVNYLLSFIKICSTCKQYYENICK